MKLIIALGNPGEQYAVTWHNLGFMVADAFLESHDTFSPYKLEKKHRALISVGTVGRQKIVVAKPQTYMNLSGEAARALKRFYKTAFEDVVVIHDDVDLPLGRLKISRNASAGGHNGIKSLIEQFGTQNFIRLRVGVNPPDRTSPTERFVLQKIPRVHRIEVQAVVKKAADALDALLTAGPAPAMNAFN